MTKKRLSPTLFLALSLGIFSATGMVGCSTHSAGGGDDDSDAVPPPDAGTDTVPQASADGAAPPADGAATAATNPDGTPVAAAGDTPPPPADGGVPPGGADAPPPAPDAAAAATPPPADMEAATPPPSTPDASAPAAPAAPAMAAATPPPVDTAAAPAPAVASAAPAEHGSGGTSDYTVRAGDTLMKIAFENYGDLYKWKDIYQQNHDAIKNPNDVPPGTVLHLDKPSVPVAIERNGDQYLIKTGDTLGTISNDVYGTKGKWKKIWNNNKQLIKDPNKIYAGFYLFYTLTPTERKNLEERGGPGHAPAPLAQATEGDGNQAVADAATDPSQNSAQAAPAAGQPQAPIAQAAPQQPPGQVVAQAQTPATDNRAPASVPGKAPGAASDDLNQVVQQVH
jgi:nucleoid-associated protein YgaU